jgi:hypothetical protein
MTTDTLTLPQHALVDGDDQTTLSRSGSSIGSDGRPVDLPRRSRRGVGRVLRLLLSDEGRKPASDHLMLLGPNGGPLWAARVR